MRTDSRSTKIRIYLRPAMGRDSVKIGIWLEQTTVEAADVLKGRRENLSIRNQQELARGVQLLV